MAATNSIRSLLIEHMPFQSLDELASLERVLEPIEERTDTIDPLFPHLVVRLVLWEGSHQTGFRHIVDVLEQSIRMPTDQTHGGRNHNFVLALKKVLTEVLGNYSRDLQGGKLNLRGKMPADLIRFDPLGKKTFGTTDEFESSLRRKSNLGQYL